MIRKIQFNHFEVNCYLVVDEPTHLCAIVDPAPEASIEDDLLQHTLHELEAQPSMVLLTHAHIDHIAGLRQVCTRYGIPVTMHPDGQKLLRQASAYGAVMGFAVDDMGDLAVNPIADGDVLHLGQTDIECRYVPGHCPGSMCFVVPSEEAVITGDALFHFSIGRTDLPGGDYNTLVGKLKERILTLPDHYAVLPGHGIYSQIGRERRYNTFLQ